MFSIAIPFFFHLIKSYGINSWMDYDAIHRNRKDWRKNKSLGGMQELPYGWDKSEMLIRYSGRTANLTLGFRWLDPKTEFKVGGINFEVISTSLKMNYMRSPEQGGSYYYSKIMDISQAIDLSSLEWRTENHRTHQKQPEWKSLQGRVCLWQWHQETIS